MSIPVLVINLDRSVNRWEKVLARANSLGIQPERVPAIDGNAIAPSQWQDFDATGFRLWHGRRPLGAEYGCYMSHISALDRIIDAGWPFAIILEDDADFLPDFMPRAEALTRLALAPGVVKLFNHRIAGFTPREETDAGDIVGRCIHGPLGSAMGYLVSLQAARALRKALLPMFLPYDIALERGWAHGQSVVLTKSPLLRSSQSASTISPSGYRATKLPLFKRIPTAFFRGQDYLRRMAYAYRK